MKKLFLLSVILFVNISSTFAQVVESKYFEYLKDAYATKSSDDVDFLVLQIKEYLETFPLSQHNDEVYFMLGEIVMKLLKLVLLIVLLVSIGMLTGCGAGYAGRPEGEPQKVYRPRADGLRIPSDSY